ncbi:MAG: hypothetical protein IVW53_14085 [Chloroflexi bacterium]|nr:hypothetical protein [Chloroflexota bacterium]
MRYSKLSRILGLQSQVPPSLAPLLTTILAKIEQIAVSASQRPEPLDVDSRVRSFGDLSPMDSDATVAILGDRGSGKTTLLNFVCAHLLDRNRDVVLPVLRPEYFGEQDTVAGWALAALHRYLELEYAQLLSEPISPEEPNVTLETLLVEIRRQEAITQRGYAKALASQQLTPTEFGRDAAHLNSEGATFVEQWRRFVDALLSQVFPTPERPPLLVIPIDDADLRPELLPAIFAEVRRLSTHPGVIVLLCASESSTRFALLSQAISGRQGAYELGGLLQRGLISEAIVLDHVNKQLAKALPEHLRLTLLPMPIRDRLKFTPLDREASFLDLARQFSGPPQSQLGTLADLFALVQPAEDTQDVQPLGYGECLSPSPRALDHLYRQLEDVPRGSEARIDPFAAAAKMILDHAIKWSSSDVPLRFRQPLGWDLDLGSAGILLDFRGMVFGKQVGRGRNLGRRLIGQNRVVRNGIRRVTGYYGRPAEAGDRTGRDEPDDSEASAPNFPTAFTHALYLAQQLREIEPAFRSLGQYGRMDTPGGMAWDNVLDASLDGESTDNLFWVVPDWDEMRDYFIYVSGWNPLVDVVIDLPEGVDPVRLLDLMFVAHVQLVCDVQMMRAPSQMVTELAAQMSDIVLDEGNAFEASMASARATSAAAVRSAMARAGSAGSTIRDRDFSDWLEHLVPWAFDPLASSHASASWLRQVRSELLTEMQQLDGANAEAARYLARRLRKHLTEPWIESSLQVLNELDPATATRVRAEWQESQAQKSREFQELVDQLEAGGVPLDVIRRLRTEGISESLAEDLIAARVEPKIVAAVVSRFGARRSTSGMPAGSGATNE